jgi:hypothetical protein
MSSGNLKSHIFKEKKGHSSGMVNVKYPIIELKPVFNGPQYCDKF